MCSVARKPYFLQLLGNAQNAWAILGYTAKASRKNFHARNARVYAKCSAAQDAIRNRRAKRNHNNKAILAIALSSYRQPTVSQQYNNFKIHGPPGKNLENSSETERDQERAP